MFSTWPDLPVYKDWFLSRQEDLGRTWPGPPVVHAWSPWPVAAIPSLCPGCTPDSISPQLKAFASNASWMLPNLIVLNSQSSWKKIILDFKMSDLEGQLSQKMHHLYTKDGPMLLASMLLFKELDLFRAKRPLEVFYSNPFILQMRKQVQRSWAFCPVIAAS